MIYFILFIVCCVLISLYSGVAAESSLIWQTSLVFVVIIVLVNIVIYAVKSKIDRSINGRHNEAIGLFDAEIKSVQSSIDVYEKQIAGLNNHDGYLTTEELANIFRKKFELDSISDKEIDDLLIWLAYYSPSQNEFEKCWLYDHYKRYAESCTSVWNLWCKTRDEQAVSSAALWISLGDKEIGEIMDGCNGSWKNTLLRIIICNCIHNHMMLIGGIPGADTTGGKVVSGNYYKKCVEIRDKNMKATNKEQDACISLLERSIFSKDVLSYNSLYKFDLKKYRM